MSWLDFAGEFRCERSRTMVDRKFAKTNPLRPDAEIDEPARTAAGTQA
jgi:hypothetical protein